MVDLGSNYQFNKSALALFFSYLFSLGYLTQDLKQQRYVRIPNNEIRNVMADKILQYYEAKYSVANEHFDLVSDSLQSVLDASRNNNDDELSTRIQILQSNFRKLLLKFPKFEKIKEMAVPADSDAIYHANEDLIHSVFNHIVLRLRSLSVFATEISLGDGRADIAFIERTKVLNVAGIMEIKYEKTAQNALDQIYDRKYHEEIISKYRTILLGMNVMQDKSVQIQYEIIDTAR
jgi:PD-(D/E)XK nuclease superfamily